jgi:hypothetical protein
MLLVTPSPRQALVRLSIIFWRPFSAASRAPASATTIKSLQSGRCCRVRSLSVLWKNSQMGGSRSLTTVPETLRDGRWSEGRRSEAWRFVAEIDPPRG